MYVNTQRAFAIGSQCMLASVGSPRCPSFFLAHSGSVVNGRTLYIACIEAGYLALYPNMLFYQNLRHMNLLGG